MYKKDMESFAGNFRIFLIQKARQFCEPSSNIPQEEEFDRCKEVLLELEKFVLGSETLNESCVLSSVCGKIFKSKEPVYICRDCATDGTCVFCRTCFVKSEHTKHNYQMFSSNGGGFCDCGDLEAWKSFPRCSLHGGNTEASMNANVQSYDSLEDVESDVSKLPENVKIRFLSLTKQIFEDFKYFIMRPLCKDKEEMRKEELERELNFIKSECPNVDLEEYDLVLYNNEIHNFDQVINLFKRCLSCSAEQAMKYANIVDRDGRCVALSMHVLKDIEDKQQDILTRSKIQTKVELLCRLHHPTVLAIQNFLIHSLRWLFDFVNQYRSLRLLLCQYLFYDIVTDDGQSFKKSSFIQDIFESHIETWKMARSATSNFIMTVVMKETYFKKLFAVEYVKNYNMIVEHYSSDDHNMQDSLISLSCQIFTIISLAKYLLDNHNVLRTVIQVAYDELLKNCKPLIIEGVIYPEILSFHKDESDLSKKFDPFERHLKSLNDIIYLLTSLMTSFIGYEGEEKESTSQTLHRWTSQSIVNFMDYFRIFAEILSLIQETNMIERVVEHHIEQDPQWRTGILLMYDLVPVITLTSSIITSNDVSWDLAFVVFRKILTKRLINFESKKIILFEYNNYSAKVIDNNWPNKYISVIKPLHRFMSTLLLRASYIRQLTELEVDCLFDQALQMVVFTSQQAGNMWIRNGSVPYILSQQMKCLVLTSEMFDRDIQLIQQLALHMKPEEFIVKCIHKFDLKHYFTSSPGILTEKKSLIQRVEDFLHLLISTLFFRYRPGVGKGVTREECYENIILHILCVKPMTHSKIMKKLPQVLQKYPKSKLMEIIDKVADQTKQSQIIMFNAKKSLVESSFDRFSLYYSIQDRNEAELYVQSILKSDNSPCALTSPKHIELSDDFSGLYGYLSDPCFIKILDKILLFTNEKRNSEYWTDTMLDMILYIIGACLMEDLRVLDMPKQDRRPMFLETTLDLSLNIKIIDSLECLCDKITSDQQLELIKWTIKKWHDVKKKVNGMDVDEEDQEMDIESVNVIQHNKLVKADAAKRRREQLMNRMKNMQKKFINENIDLLIEPTDEHDSGSCLSAKEHKSPRCLNMDLTCILCQEKSDKNSDRPIVAIAGAWRSTVLAKHPFTKNTFNTVESTHDVVLPVAENPLDEIDILNFRRESVSYDDSDVAHDIDRVVVRYILPVLDHPEETFITTCGHVMHYDCKTKYMTDMIKQKQTIARTKGVLYPRIYNRCPLCKCVSNIDIPIIQEDNSVNLVEEVEIMSFTKWVSFFINWSPRVTVVEPKRVDRVMQWWDKLGNQLSNIMKMTTTFKRNYSQASDDELLSCLAFRVGLAIKLQPGKLTKDTYNKFESVYSSISESSLQDIIELDYSVAYTLTVWEQILSKQNSSMLYDMPERHMLGLTYLIKAVRKSHEHLSTKDSLNRNFQSFLVLLQQMLFDATNVSLHKMWVDLYKYNAPFFILEVDFTYIMTTLLFMRTSFCSLINTTKSPEDETLSKFLQISSYNVNMVRLIYRYVSLQALLSLDKSKVDNVEVVFHQLQRDSPQLWSEEVVDNLHKIRLDISQYLSPCYLAPLPTMTKYEVAVTFSRSILSYLRCSTLLLSTLGSITYPPPFDNCNVEFNYLMGLLGLTVSVNSDVLTTSYMRSHLDVVNTMGRCPVQTVWGSNIPHSLPFTPPNLIDLPLDFTDVITLCLDRGCCLRQQSAGAVTEMTLCLICGDTFCLNGYCCRYPEESSLTVLNGAQIHARKCHGGYSLFLNTRNSKIVVMFYQARWQIYLDPIYLDKYGENDIDLKKGSPLFLNAEAYGKLQRSWLDHSIGCIVNDGFMSNDFFV